VRFLYLRLKRQNGKECSTAYFCDRAKGWSGGEETRITDQSPRLRTSQRRAADQEASNSLQTEPRGKARRNRRKTRKIKIGEKVEGGRNSFLPQESRSPQNVRTRACHESKKKGRKVRITISVKIGGKTSDRRWARSRGGRHAHPKIDVYPKVQR